MDEQLNESFAELFAQSEQQKPKTARAGDRVKATITHVGQRYADLDLGAHGDGIIEIVEFEKSEKIPQVGFQFDAFVIRIENRVAMVGKNVQKGDKAQSLIEAACQAKLPVSGLIESVNKGGFVVDVSGVRCFCPLGQMDLRRIETPESWIGQRHDFLVAEIKSDKDVVISRRQLLEQENKKRRAQIIDQLKIGNRLQGVVKTTRDFGVFIDLGGIDGFLPLNEMSFSKYGHKSLLEVGQSVETEIIKLEGEKEGAPEKITLSLRTFLTDPFLAASQELEANLIVEGVVKSIKPFGAFVELAPDLQGLIHISQFGKRIESPASIVKENDRVVVKILSIDTKERRVSLAYVNQEEALLYTGQTSTSQGIKILGRVQGEIAEKTPSTIPVVGDVVTATIDKIETFGLFVTFASGRGLVPISELDAHVRAHELKKHFPLGSQLSLAIIDIRPDGKIRLSKKALVGAEEKADADAFLRAQKNHHNGGFSILADKIKDMKIR